MGIFFRFIRTDCKKISSSVAENGLLEIKVPTDVTNEDFNKYINSLGAAKYAEIADKQKKSKEAFRKYTKKIIDKYADEFGLDFGISLQLREKTNKLNDCRIELNGMVFEGKMLFGIPIQYMPDDVVESIIRYTVYLLAIEYETRWSEIHSFTVGTGRFPDMDSFTEKSAPVSEEAKYRITIPKAKIDKMAAEYNKAVKKYNAEMQKAPIGSF